MKKVKGVGITTINHRHQRIFANQGSESSLYNS